ncbi:MAG: PspA/IM30 family protein [Pseudomonadota bacterium]|nr:PspA/IM30 family protein [Pseudomonadota bacterium]
MNSLGVFFDRLRGQVAEMSEAISGSHALRILDEQIRSTDEQLRDLRRARDTLKAHRITAQEKLDAVLAKIQQRELQAVSALRAGETQLAREVASAIVELEKARDATQTQLGAGELRMAELDHLIDRGENSLRRLKHRVDLIHAAETVAKAEESLARSAGEGLRIPTAVASAERLRERNCGQDRSQSERSAGDNAQDPLDARLAAAGIGGPASPVDAVLERLDALAQADRKPARRKPAGRSKGKP